MSHAGKTIVVVLLDLAERYLSSVMFAEVPTGIIEEPVAVCLKSGHRVETRGFFHRVGPACGNTVSTASGAIHIASP